MLIACTGKLATALRSNPSRPVHSAPQFHRRVNLDLSQHPAKRFACIVGGGLMRQLREQHNVKIDCRFWLRLVDYNIGARHDAFATSAAAAGRHDDASCSRLRSGSDTGQRCLRGTNHRAPNSPSRPQVLSDIASVKAGPAGPSYDRRERTLSQLPAPVRRADMFAVLTARLVRHYVAKYSAPAAEAWARSKGATDAEIRIARRCLRTTRQEQKSFDRYAH